MLQMRSLSEIGIPAGCRGGGGGGSFICGGLGRAEAAEGVGVGGDRAGDDHCVLWTVTRTSQIDCGEKVHFCGEKELIHLDPGQGKRPSV